MGDEIIPLTSLKKADRTIARDVRPVRMDIDDFYAIVGLLEENGQAFQVEVDGYILEDPKQIERLPQARIFRLRVKSSKPIYLSIELDQFTARVYASEDSIEATGLVAGICQIMERHVLARILWRWKWAWIITLGLASNAASGFDQVRVVLGAMGASVWVLSALTWRAFVLYPRRKHHSFYKRNKEWIDKIALLVIGSILTLAVQLLVKRSTP
jgi:hypothetical protein